MGIILYNISRPTIVFFAHVNNYDDICKITKSPILMRLSILGAALLTALTITAASPASLEQQLTTRFEKFLTGTSGADTTLPDKKISPEEADRLAPTVWSAWQKANQRIDEEKLPELRQISADSAKWHIPATLEPNAVMTFRYGSKGDMPDAGYPLFLYIHGSGEPMREWANGLRFAELFNDGPSAYFIPRIPQTGDWYRWYQRGKQYAWEKMLRQGLASGQIDPNRVYFFGISEGGYGSQRLASFYADYLAGAGPMAGGEPLKNAPAENCRNIAFSLRTGDRDYGFYRDKLTGYTKAAFDSLSAMHPGAYFHWIQLIPGRGHGIDYRHTTPWLKNFARNPYPSRVSWEDFEMDGRHRTGFYNLQVIERPDADRRTRYEMSIDNNVVNLTVDNVTYTTTETDPRWGIALKFDRSYQPATSGKIRIYFNDKLVNLNRPVTINVNGRRMFEGKLQCSLSDLVESCEEYYDPARLYPASVTIDLND